MYIERQISGEIKPFLAKREAISIIGPRQAGKTTFIENLAKELEKKGKKIKFITFEKRDDLNLFNNDIEDFKKIAQQYDVVIIDEFQYSQEGGQKLKYLYDTTKVKFIISGSSSLELTFQTGKYMVGRLHEFLLTPFSFREFLSVRDQEIVNILKKTYIVSLISPFFTNKRTELVKNPKVYFKDTGLRNFSLADFRFLDSRNDIGGLVENYGCNLLAGIFKRNVKYWRTKAKAEVDFIIEKEQSVYPVEIKYISKRVVGKSLYSFIEKFNPPIAFVLTRDYLGEERIHDTKIKFIPLTYF